MTATAEPRAEAPAASTPTVLDRAAGVELLGEVHGSGYREGAALVRRADGQMVQLGPLMYALLECVDGRRAIPELADCLSEQLGRRMGEEHVLKLAEKLAAQGLLAGTEEKAPPKSNPLLALRFKVLVTNPRVTKALTAPFTALFSPFVLVPVVLGFAAVFWFVLLEKGLAKPTADAFDRPGLLLLVFALAVLSAGFHELGHAAACRYSGGTPGGMGMGLYMVWPAFYTDVTDTYRLPRRDRLRVDLGGIYFNALVAVATTAVWLVWHVDALLLLVALQMLMMVKNLSPVIRSDGYHILADATGIPDLYAHIGPTLRRLLPGHRDEPAALTGRARFLVTAWVLVVVPVLLSLMVGAVLLLPRMLTTAWESGRGIAADLPHDVAHGHVLAVLASLLQLVALVLPVLGSALVSQRIGRTAARKAHSWSEGSPARRALLVAATALAAAGAAWAWWPSGQYRPVEAAQGGTLTQLLSAPAAVARPAPAQPAPPKLAPGTHLAVAMIPRGGATKQHPAVFFIPGKDGDPAVALLSPSGPDPGPAEGAPAAPTDTTTPTAPATAFPFKLPAKPKPGDTQAVAVGTKNGGVVYDVAYSLVTVSGGKPVTNNNSAFAFASCKACTTVAVSFQLVLVVGSSNVIAPINAAGALNVNCVACLTVAVADQLVVTLKSQPPDELVQKLMAALQQLNALSKLGKNASPALIAAVVAAVQKQIEDALDDSGLLANPPTSTTAGTTPTTPTTTEETTTTPTTSTGTAQTQTASTPTTTTPMDTTTTDTTTTGTTTTESTETTTTPSG